MIDPGKHGRALSAAAVETPRQRTFHGATEFYIREPGGNVVGFASR